MYGSARGQGRHEQVSQQERSQVVHLEGLLEAVLGHLTSAHDPAGVVGQHVDARVRRPQLARQIADLVQVGVVGQVVRGAEFVRDGSRFRW